MLDEEKKDCVKIQVDMSTYVRKYSFEELVWQLRAVAYDFREKRWMKLLDAVTGKLENE